MGYAVANTPFAAQFNKNDIGNQFAIGIFLSSADAPLPVPIVVALADAHITKIKWLLLH